LGTPFEDVQATLDANETLEILGATAGDRDGEAIDAIGDAIDVLGDAIDVLGDTVDCVLESLEVPRMNFENGDHAAQRIFDAPEAFVGLALSLLQPVDAAGCEIDHRHLIAPPGWCRKPGA